MEYKENVATLLLERLYTNGVPENPTISQLFTIMTFLKGVYYATETVTSAIGKMEVDGQPMTLEVATLFLATLRSDAGRELLRLDEVLGERMKQREAAN